MSDDRRGKSTTPFAVRHPQAPSDAGRRQVDCAGALASASPEDVHVRLDHDQLTLAEALSHRASVQQRLGRIEDAISSYTRALNVLQAIAPLGYLVWQC